MKVVYANILYDLAKGLGSNYDQVKEMVAADPRIGISHLAVQDDGGRGAGGHCFIKDFAAFRELYEKIVPDEKGLAVLKSLEEKNLELLTTTGKDLDLLREVYGDTINKK